MSQKREVPRTCVLRQEVLGLPRRWSSILLLSLFLSLSPSWICWSRDIAAVRICPVVSVSSPESHANQAAATSRTYLGCAETEAVVNIVEYYCSAALLPSTLTQIKNVCDCHFLHSIYPSTRPTCTSWTALLRILSCLINSALLGKRWRKSMPRKLSSTRLRSDP